jgi:hypothetical protein
MGHLSSMGGGAGHSRYMAPERIDPPSPSTQRTAAADVYSFAHVCVFVSAGYFTST